MYKFQNNFLNAIPWVFFSPMCIVSFINVCMRFCFIMQIMDEIANCLTNILNINININTLNDWLKTKVRILMNKYTFHIFIVVQIHLWCHFCVIYEHINLFIEPFMQVCVYLIFCQSLSCMQNATRQLL